MKKKTFEKISKIWNLRSLKIFVFVLVLAFYASFLVVQISLPYMDNDAGLYISDGKIIWENKSVFKSNPYSYVETDFPVVNHHWLSSLIFYLVSQVAGFNGVTILKTVVLLSAFAILFLTAKKRANFWLVAVLSWPTILIIKDRVRIRPEMFSYLFIAIFLYLLFDFEEHPERKRIFWLIPLQLLWVNLHIFFFVGVALVGGFLFEKIILNFPKTLKEIFSLEGYKKIFSNILIRKLFIILVILMGVSFVNPNGLSGVMAPFVSHSYENFRVSENQPLFNFKANLFSWDIFSSPYVPMVILFIISIAVNVKRKPIFWLMAGLGSAGAGLIYIRLMSLFALIFLPAVSSNFNFIFLKIREKFKKKSPKLLLFVSYSLIVVVMTIFPYTIFKMNAKASEKGYAANWGVGLDKNSNDAAIFFKEHNLKGPIFNDYDIGGYILFHLFPGEKVFVDNNGADSYPVSFFDDIFVPMLVRDDIWQEQDQKHDFNVIFISIRDGSPMVGSFLWNRLHDPKWALVYSDTYSIILLKDNKANREMIKEHRITSENVKEKIGNLLNSKDVMDKIIAGRILYLVGREDLAMSHLKKIVASYPKNSWVWLYMGSIKVLKNGFPDLVSATLFLENAVNMGEKTAEGYTWLGLAYFRLSKFDEARTAFQKALWMEPDRQDTQNYLMEMDNFIKQLKEYNQGQN